MKPSCEIVEPQLSAWLDDELGRRRRKAVNRHLEVCRDCCAEAAALRRIRELYAGLPSMRASIERTRPVEPAQDRRVAALSKGKRPALVSLISFISFTSLMGLGGLLAATALATAPFGTNRPSDAAATAAPALRDLVVEHELRVRASDPVVPPLLLEAGLGNAFVAPAGVQGEQMVITDVGGRADTKIESVDRSANGRLKVSSGAMRMSLPAAAPFSSVDAVADGKYHVVRRGIDEVAGRRCLEVAVFDDGTLRERIWVDQAAGLLIRRDSYDDGNVRRKNVFLRVRVTDTAMPAARVPVDDMAAPAYGAFDWQHSRRVDRSDLKALRAAGWTAPETLPQGYRLVAAAVTDSAEQIRRPVHLMYSDGLYQISVFEQPLGIDVNQLPPGWVSAGSDGSNAVGDVSGPTTYSWPSAWPPRVVTGTLNRTYTVIGNALPAELNEVAQHLLTDA